MLEEESVFLQEIGTLVPERVEYIGLRFGIGMSDSTQPIHTNPPLRFPCWLRKWRATPSRVTPVKSVSIKVVLQLLQMLQWLS